MEFKSREHKRINDRKLQGGVKMKKKTILILVLVLLFLLLLTNGLQGEEAKETACYMKGNDYLKLSEANKLYYVMGLMDMYFSLTHVNKTRGRFFV